MENIYKIGSWLQEKKAYIIKQWCSDDAVVNIFKKHKVNLSSFCTKFAPNILSHVIDVMQSKKEMRDCPVMNKFVDLMLQKEIKSEEILAICTTLRETVFNALLDSYPDFSNDSMSMKRILKIFDANLRGVMANFDNKRVELHADKQKELQLKRYLKRLQIILDAQDNIIFKLHDNQLYIANKALYFITGVTDIQSFKKKYKTPLAFIKHVDFHDALFKKKEYHQWISKIITEHKGQCKAQIFNHLSNQTSLMKVKITQIDALDDFVFTLENITEQQNKIDRLSGLAYKDSLTGLSNLKGFEELIEKKLSDAVNTNLKILMIELKGFSLYSEQNTKEKGDQLIKTIAQSIQERYPENSARIDSNRFAILSNNLTLESSNDLVNKIESILSSTPNTTDVNVKATVILLHDKESAESIIERGEILLNNIQGDTEEKVIDDALVAKKEEERLKQETSFLSLMQHLKSDNKSISVTNYYMEIPLKSSAKIVNISENSMTVNVRKISAISLYPKDEVYIQMPEKPNFKARVRSIAANKNDIVLDNFSAVKSSPLDRREIHVKLKEPVEILIKSEKTQIPEELETVSISTFVVYVNHLYDIKVGSELKMYTQLIDKEEDFLGNVVKIIPIADRFKLIIHLKPTPNIEKALIPFVSARQIEIIKELQEKASRL